MAKQGSDRKVIRIGNSSGVILHRRELDKLGIVGNSIVNIDIDADTQTATIRVVRTGDDNQRGA